MIRSFVAARLDRFRTWWSAPPTARDRLLGASVGAMGCFWLGLLGRLFFGPMPVSVAMLGWWAGGFAALGVVLGLMFPKVTIAVLFPISVFGIGGSG